NLRHLEIAEALGDPERELTAHVNLGVNYHTVGQLDPAIDHTRRALELTAATGRLATRGLVHNNLALILVDAGEEARARAELEQALALAERAGYRRFLPEAMSTRARLELGAGELAASERAARAALDCAREARSGVSEGMAHRLLAGVLLRAGDLGRAEAALACAHRLLAEETYEQARTWVVEARLAAARGQTDRATDLRERARRAFEHLGAALDLARLDDPADLR